MARNTTVKNNYQKFILSQLKTTEYARFSDIKPPKISSNAFSYHLKQLIAGGWVAKTDAGYTLGPKGLAEVDRNIESRQVRMQPNVVVALLVQDGYGKVLLKKRGEQPYIHHWELPAVPASVADTTVTEAAKWAAKQQLKLLPEHMRHVGDCYVRTHKGRLALNSTLYHIVRFEIDEYQTDGAFMWAEPLDLGAMSLVPGTENVVTRAFFNDEFFFDEFVVQLKNQEPLALDLSSTGKTL